MNRMEIAKTRVMEMAEQIARFELAYAEGERDLPYLDMIAFEKDQMDTLIQAINKIEYQVAFYNKNKK